MSPSSRERWRASKTVFGLAPALPLNGAVVRKLLGYRRFQDIAAAQAITRLYGASRLFVNYSQGIRELPLPAGRWLKFSLHQLKHYYQE
jgi:hypothetical protein